MKLLKSVLLTYLGPSVRPHTVFAKFHKTMIDSNDLLLCGMSNSQTQYQFFHYSDMPSTAINHIHTSKILCNINWYRMYNLPWCYNHVCHCNQIILLESSFTGHVLRTVHYQQKSKCCVNNYCFINQNKSMHNMCKVHLHVKVHHKCFTLRVLEDTLLCVAATDNRNRYRINFIVHTPIWLSSPT